MYRNSVAKVKDQHQCMEHAAIGNPFALKKHAEKQISQEKTTWYLAEGAGFSALSYIFRLEAASMAAWNAINP